MRAEGGGSPGSHGALGSPDQEQSARFPYTTGGLGNAGFHNVRQLSEAEARL